MNGAQNPDVIVVGAGAAGLFAAIQAGRRRRRVLVLEGNDKPGRKILVSGGGRCNFTNVNVSAANYLSANPHFCKSALARFTPQDFITLVKKHGIPFHEKKLGQLFCDRSAQDIVALLLDECHEAGVQIVTNCQVQNVEKNEDEFFVKTSRGEFVSSSLVVASGGLTLPKISTDVGYRIAKHFKIGVTALRPALVPLTWDENIKKYFTPLSGISLDVVTSTEESSFRENLLFTHRGLSGPAILQISSYWNGKGELHFDLLPGRQALEELQKAKQSGEKKEIHNWLARFFPGRFAAAFCESLGVKGAVKNLSQDLVKKIGGALNDWRLVPRGTEGYVKAEVTLGGVDTDELSSKTMECKKVPGLYFIGEVVDVTGWLGGYNFQWAWASAHAAGMVV